MCPFEGILPTDADTIGRRANDNILQAEGFRRSDRSSSCECKILFLAGVPSADTIGKRIEPSRPLRVQSSAKRRVACTTT